MKYGDSLGDIMVRAWGSRMVAAALLGSAGCASSALVRPLTFLEQDPLPSGERSLRIQGFSGSNSGPVLRLDARGSQVTGELVDFYDEGSLPRVAFARDHRRWWLESVEKRFGCKPRRYKCLLVCQPSYRRGRPDWTRVMSEFEKLLTDVPMQGTPAKNVVCTGGSSWALSYRMRQGRRDEHSTLCYAEEPRRRAWEAAIDSLFWSVVLQSENAPRSTADTTRY